MPPFADRQAGFAAAVRDPEAGTPEALGPHAAGRPRRRFDVYRNNVAVGLIDALGAAFPAVDKLVGNEFFRAAARSYVDQCPPDSPLLHEYGESFPEFLEAFPPARSVPYLGDVARLEWARLTAYHAADAVPLAIDALRNLSEAAVARVRFTLHPSTAVVRSRWPVVSLWAATMGAEASDAVDMKKAEDALVVRPDLFVDTRVLPAGGYALIDSLERGDPLADAAGHGLAEAESFDLATHLEGLFQVGAVIAVDHEI